MLIALVLAGLVAGLAAAIVGQKAEAPGEADRYQIAVDDDRGWRVDTATGEVCVFTLEGVAGKAPSPRLLGCVAAPPP